MNKTQEGVRDFHKKHKHGVQYAPNMVGYGTLLLRVRLIIEEASEFATAASNDDMIGMTDALADLLYVTYGAAIVLGVDMEPICREVQRSNMTKPVKCLDAGGKVLKGEGFEPPHITIELVRQGWRA